MFFTLISGSLIHTVIPWKMQPGCLNTGKKRRGSKFRGPNAGRQPGITFVGRIVLSRCESRRLGIDDCPFCLV